MPSYTINTKIRAWGNSTSSHHVIHRQGPARNAMVVQVTYEGPEASTAQLCEAGDGLQRSNHRPSPEAAHAASDRHARRKREHVGIMRGLKAATEAARERALHRLFPEIQFAEPRTDLSHTETHESKQVYPVVMQEASPVIEQEPQEAQVVFNTLNHIEAPRPVRVSPLVLEIPRVVVPDRGFRAAIRKLSPFNERGYLKSGIPERRQRVYGNPNLLYVGKYEDPRPRTFRAAQDTIDPQSQSLVDHNKSERLISALNTSGPESQSALGASRPEYRDALRDSESTYIASITNLHGWYPGKRFYVSTEEVSTTAEVNDPTGVTTTEEEKPLRHRAQVRALDVGMRALLATLNQESRS